MIVQWGNRTWETYKPKVNKKKQSFLVGLIVADLILPATFGMGIIMAKAITKVNPLWVYQ